MNEEDFIREMNDQDMDDELYDDSYEVDIDYTTQSCYVSYPQFAFLLNEFFFIISYLIHFPLSSVDAVLVVMHFLYEQPSQ